MPHCNKQQTSFNAKYLCRGHGARKPAPLSDNEVAEILDEWEPEPLGMCLQNVCIKLCPPKLFAVPPSFTKQRANVRDAPNAVVIEEALDDCKHVLVEGKDRPLLNCATSDFLSFSSNRAVKAAAAATMEEFTFGSCGPRGFYGTTLKHLELEAALADFMGTQESITYSDNTAAVASAIPAFAKRGDLLVVDAGSNHAIQTGCKLARSKVVTFKHNDMDDLAAVLQKVADEDKKNPGRALQHRRFIVVEGISAYWGDVAPLPDIVALARHHKFRIILDDCLGFGALGPNGRGTLEHFEMPVDAVDVLVGSLSTSLSSVGGFVVGTREVADHQRLSGAGYCFSASTPPALCATATQALALMRTRPALLGDLKRNAAAMHTALQTAGLNATVTRGTVDIARAIAQDSVLPAASSVADGLWRVLSQPESPVTILQLTGVTALAVRAVAASIGKYRVAQEAASGRRATRTLTSLYSVVGSMEAMPAAPGVFTRPTGGVTPEEAQAVQGGAFAAALDKVASPEGANQQLLSVAAEAPEMEAILDAIIREAADAGVLLARARHVLQDEFAAPPRLRVNVSVAMDSGDISTVAHVLSEAAAAVCERYVRLAQERIEAIESATERITEDGVGGAGGLSTLSGAVGEDWSPPPVLLHVSALTDVAPAVRAVDETSRHVDVLYADPIENVQVYGAGLTPAQRKSTNGAAAAATLHETSQQIIKEIAALAADEHDGRLVRWSPGYPVESMAEVRAGIDMEKIGAGNPTVRPEAGGGDGIFPEKTRGGGGGSSAGSSSGRSDPGAGDDEEPTRSPVLTGRKGGSRSRSTGRARRSTAQA